MIQNFVSYVDLIVLKFIVKVVIIWKVDQKGIRIEVRRYCQVISVRLMDFKREMTVVQIRGRLVEEELWMDLRFIQELELIEVGDRLWYQIDREMLRFGFRVLV